MIISPTYVFSIYSIFFFFNDTATTEIYTLSLHDALPIFDVIIQKIMSNNLIANQQDVLSFGAQVPLLVTLFFLADRKSTRLNSSHSDSSRMPSSA